MFDSPHLGKKCRLLAHPICKDTFVVSRNSDFIKSNNCSEMKEFTSNPKRALTNKQVNTTRKTETSQNSTKTSEEQAAAPTLKRQHVMSQKARA